MRTEPPSTVPSALLSHLTCKNSLPSFPPGQSLVLPLWHMITWLCPSFLLSFLAPDKDTFSFSHTTWEDDLLSHMWKHGSLHPSIILRARPSLFLLPHENTASFLHCTMWKHGLFHPCARAHPPQGWKVMHSGLFQTWLWISSPGCSFASLWGVSAVCPNCCENL